MQYSLSETHTGWENIYFIKTMIQECTNGGAGLMWKIAVCDEEKHFQNYIKEILMEYQKVKNTKYEVDTFGSGKEIVNSGTGISQYKIVFLDILMEEQDGLLTAKWIRELNKDIFIVFVTAFAEYSLEGYKVDAVRYILKDDENFSYCICECMDAIFEKMHHKAIWKEFHFSIGRRKISLDHILYIESRLHKLEFHMMEHTSLPYTLYGTLKQMEMELLDTGFIRIHQSYLVNMKYIAEICRYYALLKNGIRLEIPKARYKAVEEMFCAYKGKI